MSTTEGNNSEKHSAEQDALFIKSEEDYLRVLLGAYHPSIYFRAVYVPYTEDDIARIDRQVRTGEPAYGRRDYELASSWKEKQRILEVYTTAYHEAFHYFQTLVTSFGIFDQFFRTTRNNIFLDILLQYNGLADKSLGDFVKENEDLFEGDSALSREALLLSGILEGARLYRAEEPLPLCENSMFKIIPLPVNQRIYPQICIEINGVLYPFGAHVLMESWAFSAFKGAISVGLGSTAAQDYAERLSIPFFPYKILDYLIHQIVPSEEILNNDLFLSYMASVLAYYGLNHEPYNPINPSFGLGLFPGYRVAHLIEMLRDYLKEKGTLGPSTIFDTWDCALHLDASMSWNSFISNGYTTQTDITAYMSQITGHEQWHLKTYSFGAHARFMGDAHTAILATLSDTSAIFEIQRWIMHYHESDIFRPPISLFVKNINGKEVRELRVPEEDPKEIAFWSSYYEISSIVEQKTSSSTWQCPLSRVGHSVCTDFDISVCYTQWSSFDPPSNLSKKHCKIIRILKGLNRGQD